MNVQKGGKMEEDVKETEQPNEHLDNQKQAQIEKKLRLENQHISGANWYFWIAGLSMINTIILMSGGQWSFIIGLGLTQIIDSIALQMGAELVGFAKIIAFIIDLCIAGIFVLFGVFARKKHVWAFIVGMILYAFDGLLFLLIKDFMSLGFHVFALFFLFGGLKAVQEIKKLDYEQSLADTGLVPPVS